MIQKQFVAQVLLAMGKMESTITCFLVSTEVWIRGPSWRTHIGHGHLTSYALNPWLLDAGVASQVLHVARAGDHREVI